MRHFKAELGAEGRATQSEILAKINEKMKTLLGDEAVKYREVPKTLPEWDSLRDKKVLLVTDLIEVLKSLIPELLAATEGKAEFFKYDGEDMSDLVEYILSSNSDMVILSDTLSEGVEGSEIVRELNKFNFSGKVVGIGKNGGDFEEAGVDNFISDYDLEEPDQIISTVAAIA